MFLLWKLESLISELRDGILWHVFYVVLCVVDLGAPESKGLKILPKWDSFKKIFPEDFIVRVNTKGVYKYDTYFRVMNCCQLFCNRFGSKQAKKLNIGHIQTIFDIFCLDQKTDWMHLQVWVEPSATTLVKLKENRKTRLDKTFTHIHPPTTSIWWNWKEKSDQVKSRYVQKMKKKGLGVWREYKLWR